MNSLLSNALASLPDLWSASERIAGLRGAQIREVTITGWRYVSITGGTREALRDIGISRNWYRVGSPGFDRMAEQAAASEGIILRDASSEALSRGMGRGLARSLAAGSRLSVPVAVLVDVADEVIVRGTNPRDLVSWEYAAELAEEAAIGTAAAAVGYVASAGATALMGAAFGSVAPVVGTIVGFVAGAAAGLLLSAIDW